MSEDLENVWLLRRDFEEWMNRHYPRRLVKCDYCGEWISEGEECLKLPANSWMCSKCIGEYLITDLEEDQIE